MSASALVPELRSRNAPHRLFLTDFASVKPILMHLGLSADPPRVALARDPPLDDLDQTPAFDPADPAPEPEYEFDQSVSW
jgi:hypothetical protein